MKGGVVGAGLAAWLLVGCSAPSEAVRLDVYAAASLSEVFEALGEEFERDHAGVEVTLNLAGSQTLATQILAGAPADVFASADEFQMERVLEEIDPAAGPWAFATNRLVIVVEAGNPRRITGLQDLARPELTVVLAAPEVPAGRYTAIALDRAGVVVRAASQEADVRAVLSKVALGEADAGVVYHSDILAAGDRVEGVQIPEDLNVLARYPLVVVPGGEERIAFEFAELVRSEAGQRRLALAGFG